MEFNDLMKKIVSLNHFRWKSIYICWGWCYFFINKNYNDINIIWLQILIIIIKKINNNENSIFQIKKKKLIK